MSYYVITTKKPQADAEDRSLHVEGGVRVLLSPKGFLAASGIHNNLLIFLPDFYMS
jgi:hypothetical protein